MEAIVLTWTDSVKDSSTSSTWSSLEVSIFAQSNSKNNLHVCLDSKLKAKKQRNGFLCGTYLFLKTVTLFYVFILF